MKNKMILFVGIAFWSIPLLMILSLITGAFDGKGPDSLGILLIFLDIGGPITFAVYISWIYFFLKWYRSKK